MYFESVENQRSIALHGHDDNGFIRSYFIRMMLSFHSTKIEINDSEADQEYTKYIFIHSFIENPFCEFSHNQDLDT